MAGKPPRQITEIILYSPGHGFLETVYATNSTHGRIYPIPAVYFVESMMISSDFFVITTIESDYFV
ncbi:hypothetical protein E6H31_07265 [Candidatus Bathyarchaeota archaeon]|nr:MAG: hypothetical protein E6H31_07265 [Candidatus Bathyarchaeota archaeon]